jgi:hypothetical protein
VVKPALGLHSEHEGDVGVAPSTTAEGGAHLGRSSMREVVGGGGVVVLHGDERLTANGNNATKILQLEEMEEHLMHDMN